MGSPRISYSARPDATETTELAALAAIYRLLIDSANERGRNPDSEASGREAHRDSHDRKAVPSGPSS